MFELTKKLKEKECNREAHRRAMICVNCREHYKKFGGKPGICTITNEPIGPLDDHPGMVTQDRECPKGHW